MTETPANTDMGDGSEVKKCSFIFRSGVFWCVEWGVQCSGMAVDQRWPLGLERGL